MLPGCFEMFRADGTGCFFSFISQYNFYISDEFRISSFFFSVLFAAFFLFFALFLVLSFSLPLSHTRSLTLSLSLSHVRSLSNFLFSDFLTQNYKINFFFFLFYSNGYRDISFSHRWYGFHFSVIVCSEYPWLYGNCNSIGTVNWTDDIRLTLFIIRKLLHETAACFSRLYL